MMKAMEVSMIEFRKCNDGTVFVQLQSGREVLV
jgi:hypothetical protein